MYIKQTLASYTFLPLTHSTMLKLILFFFFPLISTIAATGTGIGPHCTTTTTTNSPILLKPYQKCVNLPTQEASFSWTYHHLNSTLETAFYGSFISPSGWVGVGLNPTSPQMTGTRSLIAFSDPTSSSLLLLPFLLDPSVKLQSSPLLSHPFPNSGSHLRLVSSSATLLSSPSVAADAAIEIRATFKLLNPNLTKINLVWNRGLYVQNLSPTIHPTSPSDLNSRATIDLLSPSASVKFKPTISSTLRPIHAILNALSWGFFLPIGVITARYLRHCPSAGPTWFYAHAAIQIPGFLLGTAGFATGLIMGKESIGIVYGMHRGLGIGVFCMGALQAAALVMRPGTTSRYRRYWKSYHHLVGYGCVVVGVVNVFQGMEVMGVGGGSYWRLAYCLVVATMVGGCVGLEVNGWVVFCRKVEEEKVKREGGGRSEVGMMKGAWGGSI